MDRRSFLLALCGVSSIADLERIAEDVQGKTDPGKSYKLQIAFLGEIEYYLEDGQPQRDGWPGGAVFDAVCDRLAAMGHTIEVKEVA